MKTRTAAQIWTAYQEINPHAPADYRAWAFGDSKEMADELGALVLEGKKTATASSYLHYDGDDDPLPYVGLHNVLLDGEGNAIAILETTSVEVVPFDEVSAEQAYMEGEGDRTLAYWRRVHETFFRRWFEEIEDDFNPQIPVVCEVFRVVYK